MQWGRPGRREVLLAGVLGVVALVAIGVGIYRVSGPRLTGGGGGFDSCWTAPSPAAWTRMNRSGIAFALDYFALSPGAGGVNVTSADLIAPRGGLRLLKVIFAPDGRVGDGTIGHFAVPDYAQTLVRTVPAHLAAMSRPAGAPADFRGSTWQLAVLVSAPPQATEASAAGVRLTYSTGPWTRTAEAGDLFGMVAGPASRGGCPTAR